MTNLILRINNTVTDSNYATAPGNYIAVDDTLDTFIFSNGSAQIADGQGIPSEEDLNRAAVLLDGVLEVIVPKYILKDVSGSILKEVKLAGNQNKRYVFAACFDGATATEPVLEAWDNNSINTYALACLGTGVPNNSWFKAKCTTDALPGVDWAGTPLAGSGGSNHVLLNNDAGALTVAKDLYFNLKIIIPGGISTPSLYTPTLLITFTTN